MNNYSTQGNKKYNVHIFTVVRVFVPNVEAKDMTDAVNRAAAKTDFYEIFRSHGHLPDTDWGEEHSHFLVDVVGDEEFSQSQWVDKEGRVLDGPFEMEIHPAHDISRWH